MHEVTATFDVDRVDPTLDDPHDVVGLILDVYNEWARANDKPQAGVNSFEAEWA